MSQCVRDNLVFGRKVVAMLDVFITRRNHDDFSNLARQRCDMLSGIVCVGLKIKWSQTHKTIQICPFWYTRFLLMHDKIALDPVHASRQLSMSLAQLGIITTKRQSQYFRRDLSSETTPCLGRCVCPPCAVAPHRRFWRSASPYALLILSRFPNKCTFWMQMDAPQLPGIEHAEERACSCHLRASRSLHTIEGVCNPSVRLSLTV